MEFCKEKIWTCCLQLFPTNRVQNCCSLEKVGLGVGEGRGLLPVKAFVDPSWPEGRLAWIFLEIRKAAHPSLPPHSHFASYHPSSLSSPTISDKFFPFHPSLLSSIPSSYCSFHYTPYHSINTGVKYISPFHLPTTVHASFPFSQYSFSLFSIYTSHHSIFPLHAAFPFSHYSFSLSSNYIPQFHLPTTVHASCPFCHYRFSPILLLRPTIPSSHYLLPFHSPTTVFPILLLHPTLPSSPLLANIKFFQSFHLLIIFLSPP